MVRINNILLQNVSRLSDRAQSFDVRIVDGLIKEIGSQLDHGTSTVVPLTGKLITEGWCELFTDFSDPGFEYREDLTSGALAAAAGGFTDVCVLPNTSPVVDSKADIQYIKSKEAIVPVSLHAVGALSVEAKGERIAELYDMWHAGAVYFSDGTTPAWNAELLLKALQYTQRFDGMVVTRPLDKELSQFGQMHEGPVSTSLGLKGIPSVAETVTLRRDLELLRYGGGRMHVTGLSTAESVQLVREAKEEGLRITCDVPLYNLLFADQDAPPFDTSYKVLPPLRQDRDREALLGGLKGGVIDAISAHHFPRDVEEKDLEYDLAEFGATALQTVYSALQQLSGVVDLELLMDKVGNAPRRILGIEPAVIEQGASAKIAVLDEQAVWTYDEQTNLSKSRNSPLFGKELTGRVAGIVNGSNVYLPEYL
ncbi:MAG: dihydroorotase [Bacteroidota bacterium]